MGTKKGKAPKAPRGHSAPVQIAYLEVENLGGIERFAIEELGPLTVLEGANGAGKSTVLAALTATLLGGAEGRGLLRVGAKSGKLTVGLTNGWTVRGRWTEKGSTVDVTDADGATVPKPREQLTTLVRGLGFAPARFLTASNAERVRMLAGLVIDPDVTARACAVLEGLGWESDDVRALVSDPTQDSTFALLEAARRQLTEARRAIGRQQKQAEGTVANLRGVAAAADATDWPQVLAERRAAVTQLRRATEAHLDRVRAQHETAIAAAREALATAEQAQAAALAAVRERSVAFIAKAEGAVREAEQGQQAAAAAAGTRAEFARAQADAKQHATHYAQHTEALQACDALTAELVAQLPGGLVIADGVLQVQHDDGAIAFDQASTGERMAAAVQVAQVMAGDFAVMCLDGLEAFDEDNLAAFADACTAAGLQGIGAKVAAGALKAVQA